MKGSDDSIQTGGDLELAKCAEKSVGFRVPFPLTRDTSFTFFDSICYGKVVVDDTRHRMEREWQVVRVLRSGSVVMSMRGRKAHRTRVREPAEEWQWREEGPYD